MTNKPALRSILPAAFPDLIKNAAFLDIPIGIQKAISPIGYPLINALHKLKDVNNSVIGRLILYNPAPKQKRLSNNFRTLKPVASHQ